MVCILNADVGVVVLALRIFSKRISICFLGSGKALNVTTCPEMVHNRGTFFDWVLVGSADMSLF